MATVCTSSACGTGSWSGPLPGDPDNNSVLSATSEYGGIQLSWSMPNTNAYAVAFTQVFRGLDATFETAIPLSYASGNEYYDKTASDVIRPYFYWIQHTSVNGTVLNPIGYVVATAKPEIDGVLLALAGRVESTALAESLRERISAISTLETGLTHLSTSVVTENSVLSQELTALRQDMTDTMAYVDQQQAIQVSAQQAMVTSVNTQLAQINSGLYAAIQEESTTRAEETGELFAQKILKIDLAGNVAGFGLAASKDPDGTYTSDFQVRADTFSIAPPTVVSDTEPSTPFNGMVWEDTSTDPSTTRWYSSSTAAWQTTPVAGAIPFIVKTTPEVIDGYTVEPGVYIDTACISKLSASKIDTRGLIIKDALGNVLIRAGTPLDEFAAGGTISSRINFQVADGLFVGSDIDNGLYMGVDGLVAKKAGITTLSISNDGSAVFAGDLTASSISADYIIPGAVSNHYGLLYETDTYITLFTQERNVQGAVFSLSVPVVSGRSKVLISAQIQLKISMTDSSIYGAGSAYVRLYRNGVLLRNMLGVYVSHDTDGAGSTSASAYVSIGPLVDVPTETGDALYSVEIYMGVVSTSTQYATLAYADRSISITVLNA